MQGYIPPPTSGVPVSAGVPFMGGVPPTYPAYSTGMNMLQPSQQGVPNTPDTRKKVVDIASAPPSQIRGRTPQDWIEYRTAEGTPYWYNKVTKASTWEMPEEIRMTKKEENADADSKSKTGNQNPQALTRGIRVWNVYKTADGREYYHNVQTNQTTWDKPANLEEEFFPEIKDSESKQPTDSKIVSHEDIAAAMKSMTTSGSVHISQGSSEVDEDEENEEKSNIPQFTNKKDAINCFKQLFDEYEIRPDDKWDKIVKKIHKDKRYHVLKSKGERNHAFNEWKDQKRKQEREEQIIRRRNARESFLAMLSECKDITSSMSWRKAAKYVDADKKEYDILDEREKEDLFLDHVEVLERKEREERKKKRKEAMDAFRKLLEETKEITYRTSWRKAKELVGKDERYSKLDKRDRERVFDDYRRELERAEEQAREEEKERKKKQERMERDAFRELLVERVDKGELNFKTKWKDFLPTIEDDGRYLTVLAQPGNVPKDLFGDFIEELYNKVKDMKKRLKTFMTENNVELTAEMSEEDLGKKVKEVDTEGKVTDIIDSRDFHHIHSHFIERLKEKIKENERKQEKYIHKFRELLSRLQISPETTFEDNLEELSKHSAFRHLESDDLKKKLFNEYVEAVKSGALHVSGSSKMDVDNESEDTPSRKRKRSQSRDTEDHDRESEEPAHKVQKTVSADKE